MRLNRNSPGRLVTKAVKRKSPAILSKILSVESQNNTPTKPEIRKKINHLQRLIMRRFRIDSVSCSADFAVRIVEIL